MVGRKGREVAQLHGEVVEAEPVAVARPVAAALPARSRDGRNVLVIQEHHHHAATEARPVPPSRLVPWALIALAACILAFACFASWHTWIGPQVDPVRPHPVDLVGPSR